MCHKVTIATEVRDQVAAACCRLVVSEPAHGSATQYSREVAGLLVKLLGWVFPTFLDTAIGPILTSTTPV